MGVIKEVAYRSALTLDPMMDEAIVDCALATQLNTALQPMPGGSAEC